VECFVESPAIAEGSLTIFKNKLVLARMRSAEENREVPRFTNLTASDLKAPTSLLLDLFHVLGRLQRIGNRRYRRVHPIATETDEVLPCSLVVPIGKLAKTDSFSHVIHI